MNKANRLNWLKQHAKSNTISGVLAILSWSLPHCGTAQSGLSARLTRTSVSPDDKFVLVTIGEDSLEKELSHSSLDEFDREDIRSIRAKYPKSGLYRNDGSTKPLWTYDERLGVNAIIAPDGQHAVFEGDWTWDEYGLRAATFTRNGKVIRSYTDVEIIPQWRLKAMLNGWEPPTCAGTSFDPQQMTYTIRTNQNEEFVFDVKNGDIIDVRSPFPTLYAAALGASALLFGLCVALWRQKRRNEVR